MFLEEFLSCKMHLQFPLSSVERAGITAPFPKLGRKKLKQLGLLGCGGFGAVELVQHVP